MTKHYSKFANLEEKRNIRRATGFLALTGVTLILLFFFGLPLVIKFAAFLTDVKKTSTPIEITDTTPPAPPHLENLPDATNESSLEITGESESGATVLIFVNKEEKELVADEEGKFSTKLALLDGENIIYTYARDKSGNESQKTREFKVVFDNVAPKLEITTPPDETQFSGSKNQKVNIQGITDPEVNLTINERFVSVREDGNFSFSVTLLEGDNPFYIKAVDAAGNLAEKNLILKYSP